MVEIAILILEFIIVFLVVYLLDYFVNIKSMKKYNRASLPANIKYIVYKYKLDIVKIGYKDVVGKLALCDALTISTVYMITKVINNIYIRLVVAFILAFPLVAIAYRYVANYYKKKEND